MNQPASTTFADRHVGPRAHDLSRMLEAVGFDSLDALMDAAVPSAIQSRTLDLPEPLSEHDAARELRRLAGRNRPAESMIGLGYHATITPPVIRRNVLEDPSWYTAYTPYQPEISQGRLEALLNFQTVIGDLTGLPTANASLLDEGTAAAEAMTLVRRAKRTAVGPFVVDADALPQTIEVIHTRAAAMNIEVVVADLTEGLPEGDLCGVLVQYPGASGRILDPRPVIEAAHERDALAVIAADLLALTLLESPGELGADLVVGSSQRFGVPLFYGGPHAGFMSVAAGLERHLPGRLVGVSVDAEGRPAYRLALQTREQHIRRDKATSNICTAQVLLAVVASMYAVYHGPEGLRGDRGDDPSPRHHAGRDAGGGRGRGRPRRLRRHRAGARAGGGRSGCRPRPRSRSPPAARRRRPRRRQRGRDRVGGRTIGAAARAVAGDREIGGWFATGAVPDSLARRTPYLTHEVFHSYRSETQMLRYLRRLSARDYALDRGMIPLGSCTMKLNATTEMEPVSTPGFAELHPFAPAEDAEGYRELITQLETWLAEATGYDRVSIQPNAGSQGELAGLLAIRGYHHSRGDEDRTVCLIPSSAHGTNAASAVMAGMKVVVVKAADDGTVDLDDLRRLCEEHRDDLAAIMVTYPSTHGAYEGSITDLCRLVHEAGGQVYVDGANLNALLGHARPGEFGGDVSHLNLHKTFCIPHGGGGPGVGPVGVRAHLAPFLPSHHQHPDPAQREGVGAVSAAPYGSAGILPISWAYIAMMGAEGLRKATATAVLSANYIARRLDDAFPVLYKGQGGLVAHECILDLRPVTKASGVTVDDVAKRLIDYGFHAPTMSFPVAGTLMVEPTESEDLGEIDRFCDAMLAIRAEIDQVERGEWSVEKSPLRGAPHTTRAIVGDWDRAYPRAVAAFPTGADPDKYWPPVARIDQAYGDRHLVCSCPPPDAFAED